MCRAIVSRQYTYAYAAVSVDDGRLDTLVLPHVNAECMQLFVDELSRRHRSEHVVLVLDGAQLAPPSRGCRTFSEKWCGSARFLL